MLRTATCLAAIVVASMLGNRVAAQSGSAPPAAGPASALPAPFVTRQPEIEVPFTVKQATTPDAQPASVRVFLSWDNGATWRFYQEKKPSDGRFRFTAKQDGEYWFATQTFDIQGRGPKEPPKAPQLRLVLDTQKPTLQVNADAAADGQVAVTWTAVDPHLSPQSLKIECQDANGSGGWQSVVSSAPGPTAPGQVSGRVAFSPRSASGAINLRAEVADLSGNVAYYSQRIALPQSAQRTAAGAPELAVSDPAATAWPAEGDDSQVAQRADRSRSPTPINDDSALTSAAPKHIDNPYSRTDRLASLPNYEAVPSRAQPAVSSSASPAAEALPPPRGADDNPSARAALSPSADILPANVAPADQPTYSPPKSTGENLPSPNRGSSGYSSNVAPTAPEPIAPRSVGAGSIAGGGETLPDRPRMTNSKRFSLEYDVETVGPEGLADVELWGTADQGRSWQKWGSDPDKLSPFDVEVAGEGSFGFRVVIVGKNGLASNTPQAGDTADIWVGVDQTNPTARITAAAYGSGEQAGKLDIRWEAADVNLALRPITLSMSEQAGGPFTPIAAGLPNSGHYLWDFDPRSPRQIYLRLEVRDEAGNQTLDQLSEPIQVDGLAPKGRIRGFSPAADRQGAFRSPLFRSR